MDKKAKKGNLSVFKYPTIYLGLISLLFLLSSCATSTGKTEGKTKSTSSEISQSKLTSKSSSPSKKIEHGAVPTQKELTYYQWEWSDHIILFTDTETISLSKDPERHFRTSTRKYRLENDVITFDYSDDQKKLEEAGNPQGIVLNGAFKISWNGDNLLLTPNDELPNKKERSMTYTIRTKE